MINLFNVFKEVFSTSAEQNEYTGDRQESVFYPYYVAGAYPSQINGVFAEHLAWAFTTVCNPRVVAICRDSRRSSVSLTTHLAQTFLTQGVDVVEFGLVTTPFAAWVAREKGIDAIMVTASQDRADWNGFKLYSAATGEPINIENDLKKIQERVEAGGISRVRAGTKGSVIRHTEYYREYKKLLVEAATGSPHKKKLASPLRIAVDYSSGTGSIFVNDMLRTLGVSFNTLNEQSNGTFPCHGPSPITEDAWGGLSNLVKHGRYHLGVAFDVAGERAIFLDEKGQFIPTSQVASLLVSFYVPRADHWKNIVISGGISNSVEMVTKNVGGRTYIAPEDYLNIASQMREHRAVMGASRGGHYFFKDFGYWDGGAFALAKVLNVLASQERAQLSELVSLFKGSEVLPQLSIPYEPDTEDAVLHELAKHFKGETVRQGGLRVVFKTWWFYIYYNIDRTEWTLFLEGESRERLEHKRREIETIVKNIKELTKK